MEDMEIPKPQYPMLLKLLMGIGVMFLGSLGLLLLSLIFGMMGFALGIPELSVFTLMMEQVGVVMLGLSIMVGGVLSVVGLTVKSLTPAGGQIQDKQKNESRLYDIRDEGLTVEDVLADLSLAERELLAEKLATSRLTIREDGTLIPLEQAEKLYKVERFIDG